MQSIKNEFFDNILYQYQDVYKQIGNSFTV